MKGDKEKRYIVLASDFMNYGRMEVQKISGPYTKEEAEQVVRGIVCKHNEHEFAEAIPLGKGDFSIHVPSEAYEKTFPEEFEEADDSLANLSVINPEAVVT